MATFNLKIFSPYGVHYEGQAESITLRTVTGDATVLPNHSDWVTALDTGKCIVKIDGERRTAVCNRGLLNVEKNNVQVLTSTFEWEEEIDLERATQQLAIRQKELENAKSEFEKNLAKMRVKRELLRTQVKTEN